MIDRQTQFTKKKKKKKLKKKKEKPPERFELSTPGLQDQCSNRWAMEATHNKPQNKHKF